VALRNAPKERAFGFIPVLAHPAGGSDDGEHVFEYAIRFTPRGDFRANRIAFTARQVLRELPCAPEGLEMELLAKGTLVVDHPEIMVTAMKIASRGEGVIARLQSFAAGPTEIHLHSPIRPIRSAWTCDARERDLAALPVHDGSVHASLERSITSIRLVFE
jgi:alpha-mannosidase